MKKKKIVLLLISIIIWAISVFINVYDGYLRDYNYSLIEPEYLSTGILVFHIAAVIFVVLIIVFCVSKHSSTVFQRGLIGLEVGMIVFLLVTGTQYYNFAKNYNIKDGQDYIENEWLGGFSLEEIDSLCQSATDPVLVYIGREDCPDCRMFEKKITPLLETNSIEMPTYYTNLDRDNNKEELDRFLEKYHIESVPFLIYIINGKVIATWDDPVTDIVEIQEVIENLS